MELTIVVELKSNGSGTQVVTYEAQELTAAVPILLSGIETLVHFIV